MPVFAIFRGSRLVRRVTLDEPVLKIGRVEGAQLHIEDNEVARMHAVIEVEGDNMTIIDLGSQNGTWVDGERVNKREITLGSRILVGQTTIVVERDDAPPEQRALLVPTPAIVRDRMGDAFAPTEVFGVCAIVLRVDGIRREAWSDDAELGEKLFASYPRGAIASPEIGVARSFKTIDDAQTTNLRRCSTCVIRPGFEPCSLCLGSGRGDETRGLLQCMGCDGAGYLKCTACDGTTRVVACAVRYVNDQVIRVRRALVPSVHASIRPFIEARIPVDAPWPQSNAFDPEPSMVASAYRGASAAIRAAEDFHGYYFGDALATCLQTREELTTGLARFEMQTFAVPVLWTVTGERHDAFFFDPRAELVHVGRAND